MLLQHAGAPKIYWAEAVQTVVYLKNLSITKGTHGQDATPYELWFGKKPHIQHLRVWGCTAYAHIHPAKRADKKWSPRAERLIFIGYTLSTKQYRLYNPKTKKLVTSRDVVFHEDCPYYMPLEQQIFCPANVNDSMVNVTFATGGDTDFYPVEDEVESLSGSDDFDHIVEGEEEFGEGSNGDSADQDFEEVIQTPPPVVKKTPKSRIPGQMASTLGGYWQGSAKGLRPIRKSTGGEGRSNQVTSIDVALLVADGPRTITDALDGPNRTRWIEAINSELLSLEGHKTWSVVEEGKLPMGARAISSRMVLQEKIGEDGKVARYKARLVAHGF